MGILDFEIEIFEDLKEEMLAAGENLNETILKAKVRNAIREVKGARKYPKSFSENDIVEDIRDYYYKIRDIALYDYNQIGAEFQISSSENSVSRTWIDRNDLFKGIYAIAKVF